jgi:tripartite-type tricarboxylate transporter receptor subunit TctC
MTGPATRVRPTLRILLAAFLMLLASSGAASATYPERPVTIVVPFAPGGANDVVVRIIQQPLAEALGQPVVVENRGGAGGNIGFAFVARAKPDGYTLLLAPNSFAVNVSLYAKAPYDPFKDFVPIAEISSFPVVITARPDLGVRTLQELIAHARAAPGKLNYATPGAGTLPHLATELIKLRTGIDMVHVPYAGAAPAAQALLGGTVEVATISIAAAAPLMAASRIRALAVTGAERWPDLPDVPTVTEAGVPQSVSETWQGVLAPAGTPVEAVKQLAAALVAVARREDVRVRLRQAGFAASGRGPDAFARRIAEDVPKWREVIEKTGLGGR